MTMYLVMLCFFFISNPNYRTGVSNGRSIAGIETGTEFRERGAPFQVPEPVRGHGHGERGRHSIANAGQSFKYESFGLRASGFGLRASGFRLQASGFGLQASVFRLRSSGFGLQASGFRLQASASVFRLRSSCTVAPARQLGLARGVDDPAA
ncbi:hypothetical protein [Burkholderia sp. BCC1993]|uniref:hypothetical protein n=1 Tax=Burkholderia sp. BCC1993 TaxID=2817444 RepID=UPI002AB2A296|nr:hypothetical protein [Burkholderia sp. BCC1993]